ncbi:HD domain-containing protein [Pontibacter sp. MBLB2868]|uniref:HD domain-containing protein n=1 Tax=Pontibacter sp. MBLB2868 TaxID=3451555 RepID=UPI003F756C17
MASIQFAPIQQHMVLQLQNKLPENLTYHCVAHTLDVLEQVQKIATEEGIYNADDLLLLKVAALYHDSGFIYTYQNHEAKSCDIAKKELPKYGFSQAQIETVCHMIMATRVPQEPHNHLEQILCDADLDYLGREDFEKIAQTLFKELVHHKKLEREDEWNALQIKFLDKHSYFTCYSKQNREHVKQAHLNWLKATVSQVQ